MRKINWPLEIAKFVYVTAVSLVLFLFFALVLDLFCFVCFGGWNPLLGKWPIFSGTVNAGFYSPAFSVISLLIGLGAMARVMLGDRVPALLAGMFAEEEKNLPESGNFVEKTEQERGADS